MGLRHGFGIFMLILILFPLILLSHVMIGVDRTVMNDDFVTEALAEEDAYGTVVEMVEQEFDNQSQDAPVAIDEVITEDFVQQEVERNIENFYGYLYHEQDTLDLTINLSQIHTAIAENVTNNTDDLIAEIDPQLARMRESEQEFEAVRQEVRQDAYQRIQSETDPELTQEQLEQAFQNRKDQLRDELDIADTGEVPADLEEPIQQLAEVKLDGILNESITYDTFTTELETTLDEVGPTITSAMIEDEAGIPRKINITDRINQDARQALDSGRQYVPLVRTGIYLLPLISLLFIGLLFLIARTRSGGLVTSGIPIVLVGGGTAIGFSIARDRAVERISQNVPEEAPTAASELASGIVTNVLEVFITQSYLLVALGCVGFLAAIVLFVINRDTTEETDEDIAVEEPDEGTPEQERDEETDEETQQDDDSEDGDE